jgi:transposase
MTGRPIHLQLCPGNRHDVTVALDLLENARGRKLVADAGYDSNNLIAATRAVEMKPVICSNPTRKRGRLRLDKPAYAKRILVEVFFHHLKRFRAIATRYEKTARNFLALVHLASTIIRLQSN